LGIKRLVVVVVISEDKVNVAAKSNHVKQTGFFEKESGILVP
jgi:hypothetical protein